MAKEDEMEEQNEETVPEQTRYEDLATEVPEREVDLGDYEVPKTLSEQEEETEQKTDLQVAMKLLNPAWPSKRLNDIRRPIQVSRVFPDNYLDLNYLLNVTEFEEYEEDAENLDFAAIVTGNQVATAIGYEGRGRIDVLECAGVAHEEEMEKLSKELGI